MKFSLLCFILKVLGCSLFLFIVRLVESSLMNFPHLLCSSLPGYCNLVFASNTALESPTASWRCHPMSGPSSTAWHHESASLAISSHLGFRDAASRHSLCLFSCFSPASLTESLPSYLLNISLQLNFLFGSLFFSTSIPTPAVIPLLLPNLSSRQITPKLGSHWQPLSQV